MQIAGVTIDLANPVDSVEKGIEALIRSKFTSSEVKHPSLAAAINAEVESSVNLAKVFLETYAVEKVSSVALKYVGPLLDKVAAQIPALAPEIAALKAKIPTIA